MNNVFYATTNKPEQIINKCFISSRQEFFGDIDINDYVFICEKNIGVHELWKSVRWEDNNTKLFFEKIASFNAQTSNRFASLKLFIINTALCNHIVKQTQTGFVKLSLTDGAFDIISDSNTIEKYIEDNNNFRNILLYVSDKDEASENSEDIKILYTDNDFKLVNAVFIDDNIIRRFSGKNFTNGKDAGGQKGKAYKIINNDLLTEGKHNLTNEGVLISGFYDLFVSDRDTSKKNKNKNQEGTDLQEQEQINNQEEEGESVNGTNNFPKNLILYGSPGTGKTYNSIIYAVAIVESKDLSVIEQEADKDYSAVKSRYDKYIEDGKIAFTTFHQSYGYEEFIEGIKPDTDEDGNVTYSVENGVFKDFCKKATEAVMQKSKLSDLGLNDNPTIWKVSLKGTGDNDIRKDCLKNNYIRIYYVNGEDVSAETDSKVEGRRILNAFIGGMRIGDIVLSCYTNTSIDAIGVVTGEYELREEFAEYKSVRTVKWLVKKIIKDVDAHNGNKTLTLGTVYKLKNIDSTWVYSLIDSGNQVVANKEPRVFIIDEINRGNISKIFGELITLIEDTKRLGEKEEMKAILPYSKKEFGVPNNVYILGTMNTADRSISLIDTALRRRFAFKEMMPDSELVNRIVSGINIKDVLDTMNKRIEFLYDREHQIGHSFFMKLKDNSTIENLSGIFKDKIIPLLQEYFYDDYEKIRLVLGDNQKDKNDPTQFIKKNTIESKKLFGDDKDNDFDAKAVFEINYGAFKDPQSYRFLANGQIKDTESDDGNTAQAEAAATENE